MTVFHLVQFRAMQPCHTLRDSEVFSSSPKPKTWDRGVLGLHEDQRCSPWDLRWGMLNGRFRTASDEMTIFCFCIQLGIDVATSLRILPSWIRRSRKWRPFSVEGMGSHFFHTIAILIYINISINYSLCRMPFFDYVIIFWIHSRQSTLYHSSKSSLFLTFSFAKK